MGKSTTTYKKAIADIHACAKALKAMGIKEKGDKITICMPNAPRQSPYSMR